MSYCFLVASLTGREHLLNKFIESAKKSKYKDADYYLYFQQIGLESKGDFDKSFFKDIYVSHTRDGVCLSRMYWLHRLDNYDFYIIVDDDMEFLGKEDFDTPMKFAGAISDCGLCSTECFRTIGYYDKSVQKHKFVVENVQWIFGGTVIKKSIRDLLVREIDLNPYTYDGFCLVTYVHGYTNYKYLGSITLHKAGAKNGVEYVYKNYKEFVPYFEKYIKNPYDSRGRLKLPIRESELTEEARRLHEENRK